MHRGVRTVGQPDLLEVALVAKHLLAVDGPSGLLPDGSLMVFPAGHPIGALEHGLFVPVSLDRQIGTRGVPSRGGRDLLAVGAAADMDAVAGAGLSDGFLRRSSVCSPFRGKVADGGRFLYPLLVPKMFVFCRSGAPIPHFITARVPVPNRQTEPRMDAMHADHQGVAPTISFARTMGGSWKAHRYGHWLRMEIGGRVPPLHGARNERGPWGVIVSRRPVIAATRSCRRRRFRWCRGR
jgi:hypothetical protein